MIRIVWPFPSKKLSYLLTFKVFQLFFFRYFLVFRPAAPFSIELFGPACLSSLELCLLSRPWQKVLRRIFYFLIFIQSLLFPFVLFEWTTLPFIKVFLISFSRFIFTFVCFPEAILKSRWFCEFGTAQVSSDLLWKSIGLENSLVN